MAKIAQADETIDVGGIEIPSSLLSTLAVVGFQKNGCVLINDRAQFMIPTTVDGNKLNAKYTISVMVYRDPMTEVESLEVDKVATERKAAADKKAADAQATRDRELRSVVGYIKEGQAAGIAQIRETLPVLRELQGLANVVKAVTE